MPLGRHAPLRGRPEVTSAFEADAAGARLVGAGLRALSESLIFGLLAVLLSQRHPASAAATFERRGALRLTDQHHYCRTSSSSRRTAQDVPSGGPRVHELVGLRVLVATGLFEGRRIAIYEVLRPDPLADYGLSGSGMSHTRPPSRREKVVETEVSRSTGTQVKIVDA